MTATQIDHDADLRGIESVYDTVRELKKQNAVLTARAERAERHGAILQTALSVAQKELYRLRDERDHAVQARAGIMSSLKSVGAITLDALEDARNQGYNGVLLQAQKPSVETIITTPITKSALRPAARIETVPVRNVRTELHSIGIDLNRKAVGAP